MIAIWVTNSIFGIPTPDTANAIELKRQVDIKNSVGYNKYILLYNKYNINNINIKYISIKLYNKNIINKVQKKKAKFSNILSYKEQVELLMYSTKMVESNGRYNAKSKWSSACGAYQYMPITWNNYKGFRTACLAPEWIQDARMRGEINFLWKKYHDWQKVIASHYQPGRASDRSLWNKHYYKGQPTIAEYVHNVQDTMNKVVVGLATA